MWCPHCRSEARQLEKAIAATPEQVADAVGDFAYDEMVARDVDEGDAEAIAFAIGKMLGGELKEPTFPLWLCTNVMCGLEFRAPHVGVEVAGVKPKAKGPRLDMSHDEIQDIMAGWMGY